MGTRQTTPKDLAIFLRKLAALYKNEKSGNRAWADVLERLAHGIDKNPHRTISEILSESLIREDVRRPPGRAVADREVVEEWQSLDLDGVQKVLERREVRKADLVKLAEFRFGISRSVTDKLGVEQLKTEIVNAVKHEESINEISRSARRTGSRRKS